jgi:hypothetical protein
MLIGAAGERETRDVTVLMPGTKVAYNPWTGVSTMRSFRRLVAVVVVGLVAASVHADDDQPAGPKDPEVELEVVGELGKIAGVPVSFSPDGSKVLFMTRTAEGTHAYVTAKPDGTDRKELCDSCIDWDDVLAGFLSEDMFSADGKKLALPLTANGKKYKADKAPMNVQITEPGKVTAFDTTLGTIGGLCWAGDNLYLLDVKLKGDEAWFLKVHGEKTKVLDGKEGQLALCLRASPAGDKLAFLVYDMKARKNVLAVHDIKAGSTSHSEPFLSDDVTFDGPALLYWDAEGTGVYVAETSGGKKGCLLKRYDVAKGKFENVVPDVGVAVVAVLDKENLAVWKQGKPYVLRLEDRSFHAIPVKAERTYVMGGKGDKLVLFSKAEGAKVVKFKIK